MHIDKSDCILNIPIIKVRDFLRRNKMYEWTVTSVADEIHISIFDATSLVNELEKQGYIETTEMRHGEQSWRNTIKGNALSQASAAKPVSRKTAERLLREFLGRVDNVNNDSQFLYKVNKVVLFGSYLTNEDKLNDIDLAVELKFKEQNLERRKELIHERINEARKNGKIFRSFLEEICWPEIEVRKFLKSGSRTLSIHPIEDSSLGIESGNFRIIYQES